MDIILREDVAGLGYKGELFTVSDGYARNFLVPRGLAMKASAGAAGQAESMRKAREIRDSREREVGNEIASKLVPQVINLAVSAGAGGKLYGSVTTADVVEAVKAQSSIELDKRQLTIAESIRELGTHQVAVRLHAEVQFQITLEVSAS